MAKNRNGLLGVGGQRRKVSRRALRGEGGGFSPGRGDAAAQKKELLERMRARNAAAENNGGDTSDSNED